LEAAREFTLQHIASTGDRLRDDDWVGYAFVHLLNGDHAKALACFQSVKGDETFPAALYYAALTADALGTPKLRDESLERPATDPRCRTMATAKLCPMFREVIAQGDKGRIDLAALDKLVAQVPDERRGNVLFNVGWFLALHGPTAAAEDYLKRCVDSRETYFWYRTAAIDALRKLPGVLGKATPSP